MSNYTKSTDFASKDTLPSGDSAKIVRGTEIDAEFEAIETAVATKANTSDVSSTYAPLNSPTFTGSPVLPTGTTAVTQTAGDNDTSVATTAFVTAAIAATKGPAFSVVATVGTSVPTATFTKITFDTEEYDTSTSFASSRFTPTVAGYYQINAFVNGNILLISIYKNGSEFRRGVQFAATAGGAGVASAMYLNGSTDYVEIYGYQASGSTQTLGGASVSTWFNGNLVRAA